jgi:hypothetical protein
MELGAVWMAGCCAPGCWMVAEPRRTEELPMVDEACGKATVPAG